MLIADTISCLYNFLVNNQNIASSFNDIFVYKRIENSYPCLLIDVVKVQKEIMGFNYDKFLEIDILMSIFNQTNLSDTLNLFETLLNECDEQIIKCNDLNLSFKLYYANSYDINYDIDSNTIILVSGWIIKTLQLD